MRVRVVAQLFHKVIFNPSWVFLCCSFLKGWKLTGQNQRYFCILYLFKSFNISHQSWNSQKSQKAQQLGKFEDAKSPRCLDQRLLRRRRWHNKVSVIKRKWREQIDKKPASQVLPTDNFLVQYHLLLIVRIDNSGFKIQANVHEENAIRDSI